MENYKRQVDLLLRVLPEVAKEDCFALHGGTAINLFVREMPRLSVDIDLTYIPIEDRNISLKNINEALVRIKRNIEIIIQDARIIHQHELLKLQISLKGAQIKLEVNQAGRGLLNESVKGLLCEKAQEDYDAFCVINLVSFGQLYGSKICAALDRQHPRDLFDVKYLLNNEGFTKEVKAGLILSILGSKRPIHELLFPNRLDQQLAMSNQFEGMSNEPFSYKDFETTREELIHTIHSNLLDRDKNFILSFNNLAPDWSVYDFKKFPAIQWKLRNLQKLKENNPEKFEMMFSHLKEKLNL